MSTREDLPLVSLTSQYSSCYYRWATNFLERGRAELRRIPIPRTSVNKAMRRAEAALRPDPSSCFLLTLSLAGGRANQPLVATKLAEIQDLCRKLPVGVDGLFNPDRNFQVVIRRGRTLASHRHNVRVVIGEPAVQPVNLSTPLVIVGVLGAGGKVLTCPLCVFDVLKMLPTVCSYRVVADCEYSTADMEQFTTRACVDVVLLERNP